MIALTSQTWLMQTQPSPFKVTHHLSVCDCVLLFFSVCSFSAFSSAVFCCCVSSRSSSLCLCASLSAVSALSVTCCCVCCYAVCCVICCAVKSKKHFFSGPVDFFSCFLERTEMLNISVRFGNIFFFVNYVFLSLLLSSSLQYMMTFSSSHFLCSFTSFQLASSAAWMCTIRCLKMTARSEGSSWSANSSKV